MQMSLDQRMAFCQEVFQTLFATDLTSIMVYDQVSARLFERLVKAKTLSPQWQPWVVQKNFRCFKNSTTQLYSLQGLDVCLDLTEGQATTHNYKCLNLRFLAQNPDKLDGSGNLKPNALLARAGHRIMWIINQDTNTFIGRIQDGEFIQNQPRAYTTTRRNSPVVQDDEGAEYVQQNSEWQQQLEEVPQVYHSDIPQHVIDSLS